MMIQSVSAPTLPRLLDATHPSALADAAQALQAGAVVAFPTETVYGLGGDATRDTAVAAIFAAKQRPSFNPLIVHVAAPKQVEPLVIMTPQAKALMAAFWPGPLTLVLPRHPQSPLSRLVSAGLETAAVRCPAHPVAQALITAAGCPIAAPSANRSGAISPTTAAHVRDSLGDAIPLILDGGSCRVGVESTVLDLSRDTPRLLRHGGITAEQIAAVLGQAVAPPPDQSTTLLAPGMMLSHYAPRAQVRLNASTAEADEVLLGFGPTAGADLNLSPSGDVVEAAANLFAMLHQLDADGVATIAVAPIPEQGLGLAINDRLRRAAAPRPEGATHHVS